MTLSRMFAKVLPQNDAAIVLLSNASMTQNITFTERARSG